ncbi:MAG: short-chain dehydrogenase/reductase sdr [Streptosporangiaceae bacterium]|nr:short-chain dehydrogenase/reductase sdr [Streptosporangiaceae bacterium]
MRAVLVTGASGGIGAAIAHAFAEAGDRVVVHYSSRREEAERVAAALPGEGHVAAGADIADPAQARGLVDRAAEALGGLDVLVNNAGVERPHPVLEVSYEEWQRAWQHITSINLIGPANVAYCAVQHMRDRGGRIINVSSRSACRGEPDEIAYAAAKAGLNAMGQSLAQAVGGCGIAVTTVAPGFVDAGMGDPIMAGPEGAQIRAQSPFGRVARADEVAQAVLYLASPAAEFASGAILDLFGASHLRS